MELFPRALPSGPARDIQSRMPLPQHQLTGPRRDGVFLWVTGVQLPARAESDRPLSTPKLP